MTTIWLVAVLAGLFAWVRYDQRQYARFKAAETSAVRQGYYWRWTLHSFVVLAGGALVTLVLLGRTGAVFGLPHEFQALASQLADPQSRESISADKVGGMMGGAVFGLAALMLIQYLRVRKLATPVVGDIEPLMTRNAREGWAALPLCINAGFSEELFFRLALPLLILDVTGSIGVALAGSLVIFGLMHAYQGWKGVLGTAVVGAFITLVYLRSGSLLRPMVMHALIDMIALIVRPAAARWLGQRRRLAVA
ncbi:CPBP family intramembrane glutamic endopeptidase [Sphingomonas sp. MMS12-HWE2-04]|uniref:CPBP family intramembrane glutamic endopeptidase n=1 Tax=Sphingomonas sp. MMS12-HWE2-04 TaxID=3234199 RepID=UPI00384CC2AD